MDDFLLTIIGREATSEGEATDEPLHTWRSSACSKMLSMIIYLCLSGIQSIIEPAL